jgi:uncharacterized repeat protein (TIGR03803 family)
LADTFESIEIQGALFMTSNMHHQGPRKLISNKLSPAITLAVYAAIMLTSTLVASPPLHAQTYQILYNFNPAVDGSTNPLGLTRDATGNILGVAGSNHGSVFKLDLTNRMLTTLYSFSGTPDGDHPQDPVVLDSAGNIYGTTRGGGANGLGAVFKIDPNGVETILHSFNGTDGQVPNGLIRDPAGNLYGTTVEGGLRGSGVVFRINKFGVYQTLYKFTGPPDAAQPYAGLVRDPAGNLYGTTDTGGDFSKGTIFKLAPDGTETVLHSFPGKAGGNRPFAGLLLDSAGNLYGSTFAGGTGRLGTVFKLDTSGVFSILINFSGANGEEPGELALDAAGNLYGTSYRGGGPFDDGVVFKLDPSGNETVLHSFAGRPDGSGPSERRPLVASDGTIIGSTATGGFYDAGTIFRIKP